MTDRTDLDPRDWEAFRAAAHRLLDAGIDRIRDAGAHPWQPVPDAVRAGYAIGAGSGDLADRLIEQVLPYHGGNPHPRFWGWVQGSGLASDLLSGIAGAVINANVGGRDHGAVYLERAVVDWTRQQMGMSEGVSGVLVTGTSQATVIAFATARVRALGPSVRRAGQGATQLVAYAGQGVHNAARKAAELIGIGADQLRLVPQAGGGMDLDALRAMVAADRAAGAVPFLVVGTAGSVDMGRFDDLDGLADVAAEQGLWLHVDGAFGAWTRLADPPWRALSDGIERADSIALDFHKWMYVGYDCGLVLIRDEAEHRAAFAARPAYLQGAERGLAGGDPWYCDYGIDLSRGNRALRVWCALESHGREAFGAAITANCRLARLMQDEVRARPLMRPGPDPVSNVCVFSARGGLDGAAQSALNRAIAEDLQEAGTAVFSTTDVGGVILLRAAITNHRSTADDIRAAVAAVEEAAGRLIPA
jgi:glutamate/tyrosine decarboxylase-like PLP-dependent enzyme